MFNKIFIIIISASIYSLSNTDSTISYRPLKHSVQLQINDLIDISSLNNTIICYKRLFNSKHAVRIGININGSKIEDVDTMLDSAGLYIKMRDETASIALYPTYINYCYKKNSLFMYYGLGARLNYRYYQSDKKYSETPGFNDYRKSKDYGIGLNGLLGIEWIFNRYFSLFTEYNVILNYQYSISRSNQSESKQIRKAWIVSYNNPILGVSVYF